MTASIIFSLLDGTFHGPISFISDTINFPPESNIGTLGLSIASSLWFFVVIIRLKYTEWVILDNCQKLGDKANGLNNLNWINFIAGMLSGLSLSGVAAWQIHAQHVVHYAFATVFFISGLLTLVTNTVLDHKIYYAPRYIRVLRTVLTVLAIFCFIGGVLTFSLYEYIDGDIFHNLAASFEISTSVVYLLYLLSYSFDFMDADIDFSVMIPLTLHTKMEDLVLDDSG